MVARDSPLTLMVDPAEEPARSRTPPAATREDSLLHGGFLRMTAEAPPAVTTGEPPQSAGEPAQLGRARFPGPPAGIRPYGAPYGDAPRRPDGDPRIAVPTDGDGAEPDHRPEVAGGPSDDATTGAPVDGAAVPYDGATGVPSDGGVPFDGEVPFDGGTPADGVAATPDGAAGVVPDDAAAIDEPTAEALPGLTTTYYPAVVALVPGPDATEVEVADRLGEVVGDGAGVDPAQFAAAAVLDVLRAAGWADTAEAEALRAEAERTRELLNMVVRDHRAREASAGSQQQLDWLVPLLRSAHGVAFGTLGAKVALRTAVQDVPPEVLAQAGLRIDYGVEPVYDEDPQQQH